MVILSIPRTSLREEEDRKVYATDVRLGIQVEQADRPFPAEEEAGSEFNRMYLTGECSYAFSGEVLKDEMVE